MTRSPRQFELEIDIAADPAAVWQALTDPREVARWFAPVVEADVRVGGALVWRWAGHHTWAHTIETLEPGVHLGTRYDSAVSDGAGGKRPLFVDFHLAGKAGATTLRLVHSGFGPEADFDQEFDGISGGWPVELRSLRLYLERHRGRDRALAWHSLTTQLAPGEAWARLGRVLAIERLPRLREGEAFALDVPGAGRLEGAALFAPTAREFSGVVANLGDAWFRVHCEAWGGATQVWLWLATYRGTGDMNRFQRAFETILGAIERPATRGALA